MVGPISRKERTSSHWRFEVHPRPGIGIPTFRSRLSIRRTRTGSCIHKGFYQAFIRLNEGTIGIKEKLDVVKEATKGAVPIYITGHSLGGALAQIAGAVLGNDQVAACYTFGSPRVGNFYFDLWVKVPSYRVMNYADIVPQVPLPLVYRHSGDPRYMPDHMTPSPYRFEPNLLERGWQMIRGLIQLVKAGSILGIQDHAIAAYCEKLNAIAKARDQSR